MKTFVKEGYVGEIKQTNNNDFAIDMFWELKSAFLSNNDNLKKKSFLQDKGLVDREEKFEYKYTLDYRTGEKIISILFTNKDGYDKYFTIKCRKNNGEIDRIAIMNQEGNGKNFCSDGYINNMVKGKSIMTTDIDKENMFYSLKEAISQNKLKELLNNTKKMKKIINFCGIFVEKPIRRNDNDFKKIKKNQPFISNNLVNSSVSIENDEKIIKDAEKSMKKKL